MVLWGEGTNPSTCQRRFGVTAAAW
jgi:hypothetical protein